jgi:hypothetical protein
MLGVLHRANLPFQKAFVPCPMTTWRRLFAAHRHMQCIWLQMLVRHARPASVALKDWDLSVRPSLDLNNLHASGLPCVLIIVVSAPKSVRRRHRF